MKTSNLPLSQLLVLYITPKERRKQKAYSSSLLHSNISQLCQQKQDEIRSIMAEASSKRVYQDFQPSSNWLREEGGDTFVINLPGFKREQLKVQIDSYGNLKVSGERLIADNKWSRFRKDFLIPKNCNDKEIKARFADDVLYINIPKPITQVSTQDQAMPKQQPPPNQKTETGEKLEKVNGGVTGQQREENSQADQKTEEDARKEMNGIDGKLAGSKPDNGEKMIGSLETQVHAPQKQTGYRFGMGMGLGFKEPRRVIVTAVVAIAVGLALGLYAKYRLQHASEAEAES